MLNQKCPGGMRGLISGAVLISVGLLLVVSLAHAEIRPGVSLQFSHEYNDNLLLTEDKLHNHSDSLLLDLNVNHRTNAYQTRVLLSAAKEYNSAIDDRQTFEGTAWLDVSLLPRRLSWSLQDIFSQVRLDPLLPLTPANTVNTQNLSTGPDWRWQITPADLLTTQLRAERVEYEDATLIDRDRWVSSLQWRHQLSSLWTAGLGYNSTAEKFNTLNDDIQLNTLTAVLERSSSRMQWVLTLGKTHVESSDRDESIRTIEGLYRMNPVWNLVLSAQRLVSSDIDTQQDTLDLLSKVTTQNIPSSSTSSSPSTSLSPSSSQSTSTVSSTNNVANNNLGVIFNSNNALSIDELVRFSSEWMWSHRQLSLTVSQRTTRSLALNQSLSDINDELRIDQQSLRLYNPINPRWWCELQLSLQQTTNQTTTNSIIGGGFVPQPLDEVLDEQSVLTGFGYRFTRDISMTQNLIFQRVDESTRSANALINTNNADGFRYLINLTWTL